MLNIIHMSLFPNINIKFHNIAIAITLKSTKKKKKHHIIVNKKDRLLRQCHTLHSCLHHTETV